MGAVGAYKIKLQLPDEAESTLAPAAVVPLLPMLPQQLPMPKLVSEMELITNTDMEPLRPMSFCRTMSSASSIEICCGTAGLSAALRKEGMEAFGIDFKSRLPTKAPVVKIDVSTSEGQQRTLSFLSEIQPQFIHLSPPGNTAGKARDKRITSGAPCPSKLRSNEFPAGLPGLSAQDLAQVTEANSIFRFVFHTASARVNNHEMVSVEIPSTSYAWLLPEAIAFMHMPGIRVSDFQACTQGGERPTWSRWATNIPGFQVIEQRCPGESASHKHTSFAARSRSLAEPWMQQIGSDIYPAKLCRTVASLVIQSLISSGFAPLPASFEDAGMQHDTKKQRIRASGGQFIRGNRLPQLVSEYKEIISMFIASCDIGDTVIVPGGHKGRVLRFELGEDTGVQQQDHLLPKSGPRQAIVGIFHTPMEFIQKSMAIRHPVDMPSFIPMILIKNMFWLLTTPYNEISSFRLSRLRLFRKWASESTAENEKIHSKLTPENRRVLAGKHFPLFQKILDEAGYHDLGVVENLISGTVLTGAVPKTGIFPSRMRPATLDKSGVLRASRFAREAMLRRMQASADSEIDMAVWSETEKEIAKGWLSAPMNMEQLTDLLGPDFTVARRFGIRQSGKIRAIDDYSDPEVNATVSSYEKLDLFGTDEFFILLKLIATAVQDDGTISLMPHVGERLIGKLPPGISPKSARAWLGKTFDLKSAYRQIPTDSSINNRRFCIIAVYNPHTMRPQMHIQFASPFGAVSSVYSFNRCARALWAAGAFHLRLCWCNYFDDYPIAEPRATSQGCTIAVRALCALLGWNLSLEPEKDKPFDVSCPALGIIADLSQLPEGVAVFSNKPERIEAIEQLADSILSKGRCPSVVMAELRGKSQYAANQTFGRIAAGPLHIMSEHQFRCRSGILDSETADAIRDIVTIVKHAPPRSLSCRGEMRPILVYTDGACEGIDRDQVTIGAVIIDSANLQNSVMWGGAVPEPLVRLWKQQGQVQVIGQAELLPTLMVRRACDKLFRHRRVVFFIDNDSARQALIRGFSPSCSSMNIVRLMVKAETECQVWTWYARVPTHSNPADDPSRLVFQTSAHNGFAKHILMPPIPIELFGERPLLFKADAGVGVGVLGLELVVRT